MKLNVKVFKDKDTKEWVKKDEITKERLALTEEDKVVVGMLDDLEQLPYLFEIPDLAVILCRKGYRKQSEGEWVMSEWDDNAACSLCGCEPYDFKTPERNPKIAQYCPGCGAKMRGVNFGELITWDKLKDMKAWDRAVEWAESQGVCRFCDHLPKCRKYQDDQVPINAPCMVKKRDFLEFDNSEAPNAEQR